MNVGEKISKLRKSKDLTQLDLAEKLFISDKAISSWEQNRTEPSLEMLVKISEIFDCSIGYLVYGDNPKSTVETEIKIKVSENDYKRLLNFMTQKAQFIKESNQVDTYYQPTYRKFLNDKEVNEWLRIGERGNKTILNYKNWHDNMYCNEYEVEIDNKDNLGRIFKILDLEQIAVVDKKRIIYFYLEKYEISLDFVKDLGYFIEIEVKKYTKSPIDEYSDVLKLAKNLDLNLDNIDKRGYPYHIIFGY